MTEKIKQIFSFPVAITASVGIISLITAILALIFNYLPADKIQAAPEKKIVDPRVPYIESDIITIKNDMKEMKSEFSEKLDDITDDMRILKRYILKNNNQ